MLDQADLRVVSTDSFLRQAASGNDPYDVVFADPPYTDQAALGLVLESWDLRLVADEGVMVIEQDARVLPPRGSGRVQLLRRYEYGDTVLLRYGPAPEKSVS
jgi:16S rRNA G966 N2-methylase RsmD